MSKFLKKLLTVIAILIVAIIVIAVAFGGSDDPGNTGTENNTSSTEHADSKETSEFTINNEVIADNEYCCVTVESCNESSGDIELKFLLENKTTDKTLMFATDNSAVNGWILSSDIAESVAPGKKATETLTFYSSQLKKAGIDSFDKLEFSMRVYDDNDWVADAFINDTFAIYPTGHADADVVSPQRQQGKDEMSVVDHDNCSFVILETYEDDIWGYTVSAYLENKTSDKTLMFTWEDVSVNGFMSDPLWATTVTPGNKKLVEINFSSTDFDENNIESVEEIEFNLKIYDDNDFSADYIVDEVFTYTPAQQ